MDPSSRVAGNVHALREVTCPTCDGTEVVLIGKLQDSRWFAGKRLRQALPGGNLYRCCNCQLKFRYPLLDAAIYEQLYDNTVLPTWSGDTDRPDWDLITGYILEHLPKGGRLLDFGCYTGGLLDRLGSNYERYGLEINRAAAAVAAERFRGCIWSSISDIPGGMRFDAVIATDVVEHLANPGNLIHSLSRLLKSDGILIITTGDADNSLWNRFGANWWYCFYPEHVTFLSKDWLSYLSRTAGLSIVRCETFHYFRKGIASRLANAVFAHCYGWFPVTYLRFGDLVKRMLGRPGMTSVPGGGVSADHLFVVLMGKVE